MSFYPNTSNEDKATCSSVFSTQDLLQSLCYYKLKGTSSSQVYMDVSMEALTDHYGYLFEFMTVTL